MITPGYYSLEFCLIRDELGESLHYNVTFSPGLHLVLANPGRGKSVVFLALRGVEIKNVIDDLLFEAGQNLSTHSEAKRKSFPA
jgi:hypothetical protein